MSTPRARLSAVVLAALVYCTTADPRPGAAQAAAPQAGAIPRVKLFATGGTISNRSGGRLTAEELVKSMPGVERYARVEAEQFANTASSALTLDQWVQLAKRIQQTFASDPSLGGIVVTSGTDTLEELAYFLNLTIKDERPVVVVGSMRNPSTVGYEGAANLLEGFRVAADPASRRKGALVVLNEEINAAREATKTDALRLHTFQSRPYGVLGVVDADRVVYYRDPVKRRTYQSEFDITSIDALPRVDVLLVYQGASGDLIQAAVDNGAKGIVVATAGAGATSGTQRDGIRYALGRNVPVVITTRTGSGRISLQGRRARQSDDTRLLVAGEDLTPVKARVLLMVALTRTSEPGELQRIFSEY